jgi:hypothetical protein
MSATPEAPKFSNPAAGIFIKGPRDLTLELAGRLLGEFPVAVCDLDALDEGYVAELASRTRSLGVALVAVSSSGLPYSIARNIGDCVDVTPAS